MTRTYALFATLNSNLGDNEGIDNDCRDNRRHDSDEGVRPEADLHCLRFRLVFVLNVFLLDFLRFFLVRGEGLTGEAAQACLQTKYPAHTHTKIINKWSVSKTQERIKASILRTRVVA